MRIEHGQTAVSWVEERTIKVCFRDCACCGAETPKPTTGDVLDFVHCNPGEAFMWPDEGKYEPAGWATDGDGWRCPECVGVKVAALDKHRAAKAKS